METNSCILPIKYFPLCLKSAAMIKNKLIAVWTFYRDGFREMTTGKTLWLLILIKLFILFFILKLFFFPAFLSGKTDEEKGDYVGSELIQRGNNH